MGNDSNWIIAGVIAAILLPLLSWLGVNVIVAAIIAIVTFVGLVVFLGPRKMFEGLNINAVGREKVAFARELLTAAQPAAEKLKTTAAKINDKGMRDRVNHLAEISADVMSKVEENPANASAVRRFLSFYLPRAAEVADGYAVLEDKRAPDGAKLAEVGGVLQKLEEAFVHYSDSLADQELGSLDVDLRLIQASLKEDLGR